MCRGADRRPFLFFSSAYGKAAHHYRRRMASFPFPFRAEEQQRQKGAQMDEWFTVERIDGDTFAISEYRHWEETHSYLLLGTARALLVDTGLGVADIRQVTDALSPLPVTVAIHRPSDKK